MSNKTKMNERPLRTIQVTAESNNILVGGRTNQVRRLPVKSAMVKEQENTKLSEMKKINLNEIKPMKVDNKTEMSRQEEIEWITSDHRPESYWKALAEERRVALEVTLKENEELYDVIIALKHENAQLQKLVDRCELLEEWVKELLESDDECE